jgi:mycoredoxin
VGSVSGDEAAADDRVTVYWRPGCVFCLRLRIVLRLHRLHPRMVNIWRDPDGAAFVRSAAGGNETVPTVVIDGRPVVNPEPRVVVAALRSSR